MIYRHRRADSDTRLARDSTKTFQFNPDHLIREIEDTVQEEQAKNEEVPEDVLGNIDLEIVGTLVVNRDNQNPTDGITTSYVTVRNQGTTRYDKSISEAILTLTLPHLPEDTINSWHKVIPSLDPGEEKEVVMYNGNFQMTRPRIAHGFLRDHL